MAVVKALGYDMVYTTNSTFGALYACKEVWDCDTQDNILGIRLLMTYELIIDLFSSFHCTLNYAVLSQSRLFHLCK